MKNKELLVLLLSFILSYTVFVDSRELSHSRTKRWGKGNMDGSAGTGDMSNMFRGTAGVDYPDLKTIPNTNFRCEDQVYEGGLYADVETRCQVYHVCHDGRKDSFLCGKGTIFNQQILACDYWYSTECENAPNYYYINSQIGNSGAPNNFQNNYFKHEENDQQIPGNTGDNTRVTNTGVNLNRNNPQIPRNSDNYRTSNIGNFNRHTQQQQIPGNIKDDKDNKRITNRNRSSGNSNVSNQQDAVESHNFKRMPNTAINIDGYSGHTQQCRCIRSINKTKWSFPASMIH